MIINVGAGNLRMLGDDNSFHAKNLIFIGCAKSSLTNTYDFMWWHVTRHPIHMHSFMVMIDAKQKQPGCKKCEANQKCNMYKILTCIHVHTFIR